MFKKNVQMKIGQKKRYEKQKLKKVDFRGSLRMRGKC